MTEYLDKNGLTYLWKKIKTQIYPIGSIYISTTNTSPASLWGGSWERLKDRFLLACGDTYTAGSTGGEAQHTLTIAEMPSHTHFSNDVWGGYGSREYRTGIGDVITYSKNKTHDYTKPYVDGASELDSTLSSAGNNQPHNNMPPYLAVYAWKRIA